MPPRILIFINYENRLALKVSRKMAYKSVSYRPLFTFIGLVGVKKVMHT